MNSTDSRLAKRVRQQSATDLCISSIVVYELFYGTFKSTRIEKNLAALNGLRFDILPFDAEDAREAGRIRAALEEKGTPIGPYDLLIAGQAMARNLVLVTHNTREFIRVPGLQIEDW